MIWQARRTEIEIMGVNTRAEIPRVVDDRTYRWGIEGFDRCLLFCRFGLGLDGWLGGLLSGRWDVLEQKFVSIFD